MVILKVRSLLQKHEKKYEYDVYNYSVVMSGSGVKVSVAGYKFLPTSTNSVGRNSGDVIV